MEQTAERKKLAHVSSSPHFRTPVTTRRLMLDVVIAMIPALYGAFIILVFMRWW